MNNDRPGTPGAEERDLNDDAILESGIDTARLGEIYSRTAAFYDEVVAAQQARSKLTAIEMLARRAGERFLEVGVGTGWAFQRIVEASGTDAAWGIDLAPGMIDVARERLAAAGGPAPLLLGDGGRLPFRDGVFDCLLNTYTIEVLPNEAMVPVLVECRRVLRPGGRIVAVDLTDGEGDDAAFTADWRTRFAADPECFGAARPVHLVPLLEAAGFVRIERRYVGREWPSEVVLACRPA